MQTYALKNARDEWSRIRNRKRQRLSIRRLRRRRQKQY